ncbi:MAG: hypothetical protein AAGD07_19720 [Planctomycetota bacterium]
MKVAILHSHYESGGVTAVVQNHVACLADGDAITDILLLSGKRQSALTSATRSQTAVASIDGLDYDSLVATDAPVQTRADELARRIRQVLDDHGFTPNESVLHWHNHSLGKNAATPLVVRRLSESGWRLLLQVHDFAEDQRPENYGYLREQYAASDSGTLDGVLYPTGMGVAYATLTRGDRDALTTWGLNEGSVHVIPNSVSLPVDEMPSFQTAHARVRAAFALPQDAKWVLYPVRGIRRKNVGEFVLLSQLLPEPFYGALTLRPDTPLEAANYERWRAVANAARVRLVFDAAHHPDIQFADNLSACHCVVSTSVAEGFGMSFLEPWLASRPVVGRAIPMVVGDFDAEGLRWTQRYQQVAIPGTRTWLNEVRREYRASKQRAYASLAPSFRPGLTADEDASSTDHLDRIDFADLLPKRQVEVIERAARDAAYAQDLATLNQPILDWIQEGPGDDTIQMNLATVRTRFHLDVQRDRLLSAYQCLRNGTRSTRPSDGGRMVDIIDRSHPFHPCRVETDL